MADVTMICLHLVRGVAIHCQDACDVNDDGTLELQDTVCLLGYLFAGREAPPSPGPNAPWFDPTPDALGCDSPSL